MSSEVKIQRAVEVIRIPGGELVTLEPETEVVITQALGGTFTVVTPSNGAFYRLVGKDADAIGQEPPAETPSHPAAGNLDEEVWNQLKTCYDPEIPVNIVDLGLIYDMTLEGTAESGYQVEVKMTLTAPGCGMGPTIAGEAAQKIKSLPDIKDANVELVWDPPWSPELISPEGRQRLGIDQ